MSDDAVPAVVSPLPIGQEDQLAHADVSAESEYVPDEHSAHWVSDDAVPATKAPLPMGQEDQGWHAEALVESE